MTATAAAPDSPAETYWHDSAGTDPARHAPLSGAHRADVAIIGAGYTGLSAALHLARDHGADVRVIEARAVGWGASGRSGGFCVMGGAKLPFPAMARRFGTGAVHAFVAAQRDAVELVAGIIDAEAIGCDVVPGGEWLTAHAPSRAAALRQAADELRSFGLPATLADREEMRAHGIAGAEIHAGLHLGIGFGLHPLRYVRGLAAAAARHGAALHGDSPVVAWNRQGGDHVLRTPGGEVRARRVIVATNADTPEALAAGLAGRILPALSNIIVTRPLTPAEQRAQGYVATDLAYDSRHLLHYYRLLPDGRFLLGARSSTREGPIAAARMRASMRRRLGRLFPAWADVETPHFWRGRIALAADRLPHVAPVAGLDGAFLGMAFHGSGIALGSWAGRALAGLAAGRIVAGDVPAPLAQPLPAFAFPILRPWYLRAAYGWYALRDEWP